ncbi:hypothetical protein GCM10011322_47510 [Salinarimonas ramus]|uniref:Uncharacterized protein n=1 Tax=Salinarimonas ramus TaxID=690164 RepID=A0A917QLT7_9HYPH|nr:hypothetical protein GCM10011322_47510 [Salinarimonas ramus]
MALGETRFTRPVRSPRMRSDQPAASRSSISSGPTATWFSAWCFFDVKRQPELTPFRYEDLTPSLFDVVMLGAGAAFCRRPLRRFSRSR